MKSTQLFCIATSATLMLTLSSCGLSIPASLAAAAPLPTSTPVSSSASTKVTVKSVDGRFVSGKGGMSLMLGVFAFDPAKKLAGSPGGGMKMTMEDGPPLVMTFGHGFSGSTYADYADVILDLKQLPAASREPFTLALQYTVDGEKQCGIDVKLSNLKELFISPTYIVFPDGARSMAGDGPFVDLVFDGKAIRAGKLTVTRNGSEILSSDAKANADLRVAVNATKPKNDVIAWTLKSGDGKIINKGTFGFPMGGAVPGLVEYRIALGKTSQ